MQLKVGALNTDHRVFARHLELAALDQLFQLLDVGDLLTHRTAIEQVLPHAEVRLALIGSPFSHDGCREADRPLCNRMPNLGSRLGRLVRRLLIDAQNLSNVVVIAQEVLLDYVPSLGIAHGGAEEAPNNLGRILVAIVKLAQHAIGISAVRSQRFDLRGIVETNKNLRVVAALYRVRGKLENL